MHEFDQQSHIKGVGSPKYMAPELYSKYADLHNTQKPISIV
jgi:hypothetical protein